MKANGKPKSIDDVDMEDDQALDEFTATVIAEGDKRLRAQIQQSIRLGIIDEKGNLLKYELPEDMREDADRDFGG